jgi:hypothetical protein
MKRWLVVCSVALLAALAGCDRGPEKPVAGTTKEPGISENVVNSYDQALAAASSKGRPILVIAYQGDPNKIEMHLLSEPEVSDRLPKVVTAMLEANQQALALARLGLQQYPSAAVLDRQGRMLWRMKSPRGPDLARAIDQALGVASSDLPPGGVPQQRPAGGPRMPSGHGAVGSPH